MVFSSYLFLFGFLPAALLLYYLSPRRGRNLVLTALSYLFYAWTNPAFTLLLVGATAIDYVAGLFLAGTTPWSRSEVPLLDKAAPSSLWRAFWFCHRARNESKTARRCASMFASTAATLRAPWTEAPSATISSHRTWKK